MGGLVNPCDMFIFFLTSLDHSPVMVTCSVALMISDECMYDEQVLWRTDIIVPPSVHVSSLGCEGVVLERSNMRLVGRGKLQIPRVHLH